MYSKRQAQIDALASNSLVQINSSGVAIASTAVTITSAGIVNLPLTPLLTASLSGDTGGVTGAGTSYTIIFDSIDNQQGGSNYNSGTGIYTVPTGGNGSYLITGCVGFGALTAAMTQGFIQITTTPRSYQTSIYNYGAMRTPSNQILVPFSQIVTVVATNTIRINTTISSGAGNVATILGLGTDVYSIMNIVKVG